ncbi:glutaredoxin [Tuber magnatum]|uniref:Monothiol glutaredoxin-5, mitochondrial n=1 Tax=Tuber magnatum TaxID=42249 RepID=A0A317SWN3_9PEZI|nr:glutaredoxin [Tuber magnatum]
MRFLLPKSRILFQTATRPFVPAFTNASKFSHRQQQQQQLRSLSESTRQTIEGVLSTTPVVLFMKGTPEFPQCGFSRASIQILGLQRVDPKKFAAVNVLENNEIREGIKEYSNWPTIPQLYVNKEFIGGCDILVSMHQSGELDDFLEKEKVIVPPENSDANVERPSC